LVLEFSIWMVQVWKILMQRDEWNTDIFSLPEIKMRMYLTRGGC
jgi:hypothetical protein